MQADIEKKLRVSLLLDYYGEMLSERQREIASLYYNDDLSLAEIADLIGITRQGIRDALVKSEKILESCEEKLGMVVRFGRVQAKLEEIAASLGPESEEIAARLRSLSL